MNRPRTYRPIPLALTILIALFSALVALALTGGHDAAADVSGDHHAELALRNDMRRLGKTTLPGRVWRSSNSRPTHQTPRRRSEGFWKTRSISAMR